MSIDPIIRDLQAERNHYREALERIVEGNYQPATMAKRIAEQALAAHDRGAAEMRQTIRDMADQADQEQER